MTGRVALAFSLLLLVGCENSEISGEFSQMRANKMIAALHSKGIGATAEKATGGRSQYSVKVSGGNFSQAIAILESKGLLDKEAPSFTDTIASQGLIPNSREMESLKLDYAMSLRVEELLSVVPSIESVKVVVRQHSLREGEEPAVSVTLQEKRRGSINREEIQGLVSGAVPGIPVERINIALHESDSPSEGASIVGALNIDGKVVAIPLEKFLYSVRVSKDDYHTLVGGIIILLLVFGVVGALVGYWFCFYQQSRRVYESDLPDVLQGPGTARAALPRGRRIVDIGGGGA